MSIWLKFFIDSLAFGATFIYGSTGEIITEKSGHLNLGIPGTMCMGGAGGCLVLHFIAKSSLPPFLIVTLGILGAFVFGAFFGLIYNFMTVTLRANQNVTGLALTTLGVGLMKVIISSLNATNYLKAKKMFRFPFEQRHDPLQYLGVMFFLAIVIALVASYVLYNTRVGLNLRAVGENPATADAAGINVTKYKYVATCIGSGIAGLGGLYYIVDYMGSQDAYLRIDEWGWLSIALVIFVLWRPYLTIIGSTLFGLLFSCSSYIPMIDGVSISISMKYILQMLPYLVTIFVLIITSMRKKREYQPPASLGLSYFREDR